MHYHIKEHNSNRKIFFLTFFTIQKPSEIRPCPKIGYGQPGVIIYINFKRITPKMLHSKFQGNLPSGSGKEDF